MDCLTKRRASSSLVVPTLAMNSACTGSLSRTLAPSTGLIPSPSSTTALEMTSSVPSSRSFFGAAWMTSMGRSFSAGKKSCSCSNLT